MDNQPIDFATYAQTLSQTMADAVAAAEALQAEAVADREAAHADDDARRALLHSLENKAQRKAEDEVPALQKQIKAEMAAELTEKLTRMGWTKETIEETLHR